MRFKRYGFILLLVILMACLGSCAGQPAQQLVESAAVSSEPSAPGETENKTVTAEPMPSVQSATATPTPAATGTVTVQESDTLARDIIPKLCKAFSMTEKEVKEALAREGKSNLISEKLTDYRRMEGMIPPGEYTVYEGESLSDYIKKWISLSEQRYEKLESECADKNDLKPCERLALASVVEWECLFNKHYEEVAAVFLNRLEKGDKMQSCVTAEYALGYQRPYLTLDDVAVKSDYNTYVCDGLPVGPVCAVDDASLRAAIGRKVDSDIYFFYYDYVQGEMYFFSDYKEFRAACAVSKQRFTDTLDIDPYGKVNKQELFGQGPMK